MKKLVACCSLLVVFLLFTTTTNAAMTDKYPCGASDQIQIGTPQEDCLQDNRTCTAFSHYLYTDEDGQAWCDNNNCAKPCDSPTLTPTLTVVPTMGQEEKAVFKLNQGLLPEQLVQETEINNPDILTQFLSGLSGLLNNFIGFITNKPRMYVQSGSLDQANVPSELVPKTTDLNLNIQAYLGSSSGIYGVNLPAEIQNPNIPESEKAFEQAHFPAGINPITENNKAK